MESNRHVHDNVSAIAGLHERAEQRVGRHQRIVERVAAFVGRPRALYALVAAVAGWIVYNLAAPRLGLAVVDPPPFAWLQGAISALALVMTTVVLITQNRQGRRAEHRSHLNLQVSMLAEQKIAKLIALVEELRVDLPVRDRRDLEAEDMAKPADPELVVAAIKKTIDKEGEE